MSAFQRFFESGLVIEIAIGLIMLEMVAVLWLRRKAGLIMVLGLIPGLCLMFALLAVLQGGDWRLIAFWITASLPFHLIDLRFRLRD
jgi:predicted anti-sigma-YlaC factor YlaD